MNNNNYYYYYHHHHTSHALCVCVLGTQFKKTLDWIQAKWHFLSEYSRIII